MIVLTDIAHYMLIAVDIFFKAKELKKLSKMLKGIFFKHSIKISKSEIAFKLKLAYFLLLNYPINILFIKN